MTRRLREKQEIRFSRGHTNILLSRHNRVRLTIRNTDYKLGWTDHEFHNERAENVGLEKKATDLFTWVVFFVYIVQESLVWTVWRRQTFTISRVSARTCTFFPGWLGTLYSSQFLHEDTTVNNHVNNLSQAIANFASQMRQGAIFVFRTRELWIYS